MSWPGLQGWHISIYVTVAILVIQFIVDQVLKRIYAGRGTEPPVPEPTPEALNRQLGGKRLRTGILALLGSIAVPLFAISVLGPNLADQLAGATGTGLGGLTLWLAWQTHKESQRLADYLQNLTEVSDRHSGTGTPPP
ncbi:hypothetical protein [Actinoplanes couchii]|uniref:Preprotein translocase subunit SecY n=1 Tax=Actinoplanes couchii TaxID=403638 RepID=A0ABQ3X3Q1_9ACTN|nr:hypothetical protein [Actinoplanes couchii]MDR6322887.1 putative PurR-regulated permease PerM [Actinoplanes couchii]GID53127.1 hypothetical protein Aco03nite_015310 [Actinoplanes couchii]